VNCETNARIYCNDVEIEQVIVNLISNAIDATKDLTQRWVAVSATEAEDMVILRVTDSGSGIPPNVRSKIFDPFYTTKKVGEGTGLGLSVSKGILDEHKATISVVDDSPNTCFEVRLRKHKEE
jgi:C4-dicarboxylate-specific signal transduction histidine kinase